MDVSTIAATTRLPIRRLRYVLEHRVLPGAERASRGHRRTRTFTELEAFGIACAAALLLGGLRRPLVQRCMVELLKPAGTAARRECTIAVLLQSPGPAWMEIANGDHFRAVAPSLGDNPSWRPLRLNLPPLMAPPLVVLRLDAAALRDALRTRFRTLG